MRVSAFIADSATLLSVLSFDLEICAQSCGLREHRPQPPLHPQPAWRVCVESHRSVRRQMPIRVWDMVICNWHRMLSENVLLLSSAVSYFATVGLRGVEVVDGLDRRA